MEEPGSAASACNILAGSLLVQSGGLGASIIKWSCNPCVSEASETDLLFGKNFYKLEWTHSTNRARNRPPGQARWALLCSVVHYRQGLRALLRIGHEWDPKYAQPIRSTPIRKPYEAGVNHITKNNCCPHTYPVK